MGMFAALDISTSALIAERLRMETYSDNMTNWQTVRENGARLQPFRRRTPILAAGAPGGTGAPGMGVRFVGVSHRDSFIARPSEDPANDPDAVRSTDVAQRPEFAAYVGHRLYPDMSLAEEMVDMIGASRAYEANITAIQMTRAMIQSSLQVLA